MHYYLRYFDNDKKIGCTLDGIEIDDVPSEIRYLLDNKADYVDIVRTTKTLVKDFEDDINSIRLAYTRQSKYESIMTYENGKLTNPCYFHIPGWNGSAVSFLERKNYTRVKPIKIGDAIKLMGVDEVKQNELMEDICKLHGVPEYEAKLKKYAEELEVMHEFYADYK